MHPTSQGTVQQRFLRLAVTTLTIVRRSPRDRRCGTEWKRHDVGGAVSAQSCLASSQDTAFGGHVGKVMGERVSNIGPQCDYAHRFTSGTVHSSLDVFARVGATPAHVRQFGLNKLRMVATTTTFVLSPYAPENLHRWMFVVS